MKKNSIYFLFIMIMFFYSCNNSEDFITQPQKAYTTTDYNVFVQNIDSISRCYKKIKTVKKSRGFLEYVGKGRLEKYADHGGFIAGGYIGQQLGCAIGCLTGNPVGAILGYAGGRCVGRLLGAAVASYAAVKIMEEGVRNIFKSPRIYVNNYSCNGDSIDYYIPENSVSQEDSLGYYHNKIMGVLMSQSDKYQKENGELYYELLYEDCVALAKEFNIYNDTITCNTEFRDEVINYATETANTIKSAQTNNSDIESFQDNMIINLRKRNISEEDLQIYKDIAMKIALTCDGLTNDEKKEYADDINMEITKSNIPEEMKETVSSTTNILINSSIFNDN
ncbi:hypothetical protein [Xylanibacter caecicola]|nr:hypothetical protein [Xylanibacter caecicola]